MLEDETKTYSFSYLSLNLSFKWYFAVWELTT